MSICFVEGHDDGGMQHAPRLLERPELLLLLLGASGSSVAEEGGGAGGGRLDPWWLLYLARLV